MERTTTRQDIGLSDGSDVSLMLQVQQDDTAAFALLVGRYRGRLHRFFRTLLPDPTQADDFAQEPLLRLWLARKQYMPTGSFAAYLFRIGHNYYLNHRIRQQDRNRRECAIDDLSQQLALLNHGAQPENAVMNDWEERKRREAIASLPEIYRTVFVRSHFENQRYAEIAEQLDIPVGTVKSRMAEAVRSLRLALTSEEKP